MGESGAITGSLDSISDLNFSNMARRSASKSSCCLKSIFNRGWDAKSNGLTAKSGFSLYREAASNIEGAGDDLSNNTGGDNSEGGGDTAGSFCGFGLGHEWIELVSVEVFKGDGDLDDMNGLDWVIGGTWASGDIWTKDGTFDSGMWGVGRV